LIEAARQPALRDRRIVYRVAGDGPMRASLERQIGECGLGDRFHLLGIVTDAPAFLAELDIGVICSDTEGASNALIEYMAAGRPVVATAVGGNEEMIADGVDGLLIPPGDPCALAHAIGRLIDSPDFAAKLGAAAHENVRQRYSLQTAVQTHQDFYRSLMAAGRDSAGGVAV
jgi:glycosyltransferase involved in cell wall biosynthesis